MIKSKGMYAGWLNPPRFDIHPIDVSQSLPCSCILACISRFWVEPETKQSKERRERESESERDREITVNLTENDSWFPRDSSIDEILRKIWILHRFYIRQEAQEDLHLPSSVLEKKERDSGFNGNRARISLFRCGIFNLYIFVDCNLVGCLRLGPLFLIGQTCTKSIKYKHKTFRNWRYQRYKDKFIKLI